MSKETRNLIIFFVATFVWTWAWYAPIAISGSSPYTMPWTLMLIMGGMGPSLVGVAMVLLTYDNAARRDYWRRCFSFSRISLGWWAVIFLLCPVILAASIVIDIALGGSPPPMLLLQSLVAAPTLIPLATFIRFMSGPWSEEFGWRGYAQDRMTTLFGFIPGSVLLGLIWGVWHLPLFFMPATGHGQLGFGPTGFWTFIVYNVGLALLMAWVYLGTNRSILSAMLLHFVGNYSGQLIDPRSTRASVVQALLLLALGLGACLLTLRKRAHDTGSAGVVRI